MPLRKEEIILAIQNYRCQDREEMSYKDQVLDFLGREDEYWQRTKYPAHITASAWIINASRDSVLLIFHPKLKRWLQPGGHIEEKDDTLYAAAYREAREECGLSFIYDANSEIWDIDIHTIPARNNEPEHLHLDIRFIIEASDEEATISDEHTDKLAMKWIELADIMRGPFERSMQRMAGKMI